ncbi:hypothetical protein F1559_001064 [Cyanidiococcus yangmingshanensis]|uniref:Uncharacterized protein n=1 Tax=Cyanidiococcus yangmingshanensis TaxID=2690220 RepID=A0A7J7IG00_9RHOD|nr:hypothetical protein F1559_001064 [Cyanidiococcus yangmingshanensis]
MENTGSSVAADQALTAPLDTELAESISSRLEQLLGVDSQDQRLFAPLVFALRHSSSEGEHLSARLQSLCLQIEALFLPRVLQGLIGAEERDEHSQLDEKLFIDDPTRELNTVVKALTQASGQLHTWAQTEPSSLERFSKLNPDIRKALRLYFLQLLCFGNALATGGKLETLQLVSPLWSDRQTALFYALFRDLIRLSKFLDENSIRIPEPYLSSLEKVQKVIAEHVVATRLIAQLETDPIGVHDNEIDICRMLRDADPNSFGEVVKKVTSILHMIGNRVLIEAAAVDRDWLFTLRWNHACMVYVYRLLECCFSWQEKLNGLQELFGDTDVELKAPSDMEGRGTAALEGILRAFDIALSTGAKPVIATADPSALSFELAWNDEPKNPVQTHGEDRLSRFSRDFEALRRRHQASRERVRQQSSSGVLRQQSGGEGQATSVEAHTEAGAWLSTENLVEYVCGNAAQIRKRLDAQGRLTPADWYSGGIRPVLRSLECSRASLELTWITDARRRLDAHFARSS